MSEIDSNDSPLKNIKSEADNQKLQTKANNYNKKYLNIAKNIQINESDILYNTPKQIYYENRKFKIATINYFDKIEATWKCDKHRRTKDKPSNLKYFCNSTIKGIRAIFDKKLFYFYLIEEHTKVCNLLFQQNKIQIERHSFSNNEKSEEESHEEKENSEDELPEEKKIKEKIDYDKFNYSKLISKSKKCSSLEDLDKLVLNECKINKKVLESLAFFKKNFEILYIKKKFKIKQFHLKYLYNKYKNICFPTTLDNIFEYCKIKNE